MSISSEWGGVISGQVIGTEQANDDIAGNQFDIKLWA
jgi:hypothetical protein